MACDQKKWREGKSSPYTGKLSARPAGKPGYLIAKESLRRSLPRHLFSPLQRTILRAPSMRFEGMAESIGPMWSNQTKPWGGTVPPPVGRPRAQVQERVGRTTLFSSSAMSSDRLFLDRVARQHCPSPLHRHTQINMHSPQASGKGDISTLLGWGHFYFALTQVAIDLDKHNGF
jgi:hypothetical protein